MKRFGFACAAIAALGACSKAVPEPQPDPALVERLALAGAADADSAKLDKAEGIVKVIDRSDPDRLAAPAAAMLGR